MSQMQEEASSIQIQDDSNAVLWGTAGQARAVVSWRRRCGRLTRQLPGVPEDWEAGGGGSVLSDTGGTYEVTRQSHLLEIRAT